MKLTMKKFLLISLLIILLSPYNKAYAVDGDGGVNLNAVGGGSDDSSNPSPSQGSGQGKENETFVLVNGQKYKCTYEASYTPHFILRASSIDLNGKSIISNSGKSISDVLSGTWVGVNVTESSGVSWISQNYKYYKIKKKYICNYSRETSECKSRAYSCGSPNRDCRTVFPNYTDHHETLYRNDKGQVITKCCSACSSWGSSSDTKQKEYEKEYSETFSCPGNYEHDGSYSLDSEEVEEVSEEIQYSEECHGQILTDIYDHANGMVGNTSNKVRFINLKEYPNGTEEEIKVKINESLDEVPVTKDRVEDSGKSESGEITVEYKHKPSKICINVKTAIVYYNNECDGNEELKIIPDVELSGRIYWHYFIPLNTKSNSNFFLEIEQKNNTLSKNLCEDIMKKYDNYINFIKPIDKTKIYKGDYFEGNSSSDDYDLLRLEGTCKTSIKLEYSVKQKFYNENNNKIRGYGSYYRQIDINNPFPNGLSATSIWSGLIDTTNNVIKITDKKDENKIIKKYNLSDSFKEKSYSIEHINANEIRNYNHQERNFYTSWEDMNVDGTSTFINDYLTRYNSRDYYKLGCGPANIDWEECKQ